MCRSAQQASQGKKRCLCSGPMGCQRRTNLSSRGSCKLENWKMEVIWQSAPVEHACRCVPQGRPSDGDLWGRAHVYKSRNRKAVEESLKAPQVGRDTTSPSSSLWGRTAGVSVDSHHPTTGKDRVSLGRLSSQKEQAGTSLRLTILRRHIRYRGVGWVSV